MHIVHIVQIVLIVHIVHIVHTVHIVHIVHILRIVHIMHIVLIVTTKLTIKLTTKIFSSKCSLPNAYRGECFTGMTIFERFMFIAQIFPSEFRTVERCLVLCFRVFALW